MDGWIGAITFKIMPYYYNFWYKDAQKNTTSPASLTVFVQLALRTIACRICYCLGLLSGRQQRKLIMRLTNGEFASMHVNQRKAF